MGENQQGTPGHPEKVRRFRVTRRVKPSSALPVIETREEREMRELAEMGDDADRGTPEQDAALRSGCMSFVRVVLLFFVLMIGSIIATWIFKH